jgi:predicted ArsR family transcriptional regulator
MAAMLTARSTRMEILELLRRKHGASAEAISADLGITPNAVRQHLTNLEREGLVQSEPRRHKRGRPLLQFTLTERADGIFPKRYGQLASMVLAEIQEMQGPDALDELFRRVAERQVAGMGPEIETLAFEQKLRRVLEWIARAGTFPEAHETPEGIEVSIHNCPFRNTALRFPQVCSITPQMLSLLLGTAISQAKSIHRHDAYCSFVVQRPHQAAANNQSPAELSV